VPELISHIGAQVGKVIDLPKKVRMALTGGGLVCFTLDRRGGWLGGAAEMELARFEIPIVDRDFDEGHFYWLMKESQAEWAEYVLLRAGAPLLSVVNPRNAEWAAGKGRVPAWGDADYRMRRVPREPEPQPLGWIVGRGRQGDKGTRRRGDTGVMGRLWAWLWGE